MESPGYLTLGRPGPLRSPGWFLVGRGQEAATSSPPASLPALSLKADCYCNKFQPVFELALFPGLGDKCLVLCSLLPQTPLTFPLKWKSFVQTATFKELCHMYYLISSHQSSEAEILFENFKQGNRGSRE